MFFMPKRNLFQSVRPPERLFQTTFALNECAGGTTSPFSRRLSMCISIAPQIGSIASLRAGHEMAEVADYKKLDIGVACRSEVEAGALTVKPHEFHTIRLTLPS
jgi:hypothetical protein